MTVLGSERLNAPIADIDPVLLAELIKLAILMRNKRPAEVAAEDVLRSRREFLHDSLETPGEAEDIFERILGGDELQPIAYLERGFVAARAVARVDLGSGFGTGFLIAPRVLITNNHVLPDASTASRAKAQFQFEVDLADSELPPISYRLRPEQLFYTVPQLDYSVVAVDSIALDNPTALATFGHLPLVGTTGKISEGEWLTVIQHPDGARKQICVRENQFIKRDGDKIWYSTDTKPGSSGSPVFNNDWYVVALHHAGVPANQGGAPVRNSDGSQKWIANEGIRVSRIVETLKKALPQHPLLAPLYAATPASARITARPRDAAVSPSIASSVSFRKEASMAEPRTISLPLDLKLQLLPDGQLRLMSLGGAEGTESTESGITVFLEKKSKKPAGFDVPFDDNYDKRDGYNAEFLGKGPMRIGLPTLSKSIAADAAPLIDAPGKFVLKYHNYSVVMNAKRRLPFFSAANVSFADRFDMSRPTDVWRRDPRIKAEHQLENWYYASNQFDRGHMTRREDLEFGASPMVALASAADTCHWTNCTPQHARFNQNKEIWQGIERHVLELSIVKGKFKAQIITGPILDEGDPEYRKIKYPLQFWKVVAAINASGSLFATAYVASQQAVIDQFGIEVTEVPFGAYKTYQTKITEIERLTGLTFVCGATDQDRLSKHDPLQKDTPTRRRRRRSAQESTGASLPSDYYEITELDDIQTE
jgi:endonuclease G, mitochondrial